MYTRRLDDRPPVPPENYAGTFISQQDQQNRQKQPDRQVDPPDKQSVCPSEAVNDENEPHPERDREQKYEHFEPHCRPDHTCEEHHGLIGGLFSRFGNFDLDDLLLLGLIFLLSRNRGNDCENSDDLLLILGLLLFMGF